MQRTNRQGQGFFGLESLGKGSKRMRFFFRDLNPGLASGGYSEGWVS